MTRPALVCAVKLWPSGATQVGRGQPARLDTAAAARVKLAAGVCAVVSAEDAETLLRKDA